MRFILKLQNFTLWYGMIQRNKKINKIIIVMLIERNLNYINCLNKKKVIDDVY